MMDRFNLRLFGVFWNRPIFCTSHSLSHRVSKLVWKKFFPLMHRLHICVRWCWGNISEGKYHSPWRERNESLMNMTFRTQRLVEHPSQHQSSLIKNYTVSLFTCLVFYTVYDAACALMCAFVQTICLFFLTRFHTRTNISLCRLPSWLEKKTHQRSKWGIIHAVYLDFLSDVMELLMNGT